MAKRRLDYVGADIDPTLYREAIGRLRSIGEALSAEEWAQGIRWYHDMHLLGRRLGRKYGVSRSQAIGVIAAMSPRMPWERNAIVAELILAGASGVGLPKNEAKARRIIAGENPLDVLGGFKVRSFYRNGSGRWQVVTIDVWAVRASVSDATVATWPKGGESVFDSPIRYATLAKAYSDVASEYGVAPAVFQAAVWCHVRPDSL